MNTTAAQQQWKTKKLGDIGHCLRGVSYDPTTDLSEYDKDSTIRLLRANNIQDAIINTRDIQHVESRRVSEDQIMKPNDILVCMANGSKELVGKAGQFRVMDEYTYTFGAFMACFRIDSTIAEPKFAFYLFQTREFRDFISLILAGSSINNLKPSDIESAEFQIPNRNEQRAIAEVLSDVDGLIDSLDTLIVKKRAIKQSIMQQLLTGKTRLSGFSGKWETKRLGEIGEISGAGVDKKVNPNEVPVRLVNYLDVYNKTFLYSKDLTHEVSARPDQVRRCVVEKGDIFFTPSSEVPDDIGCSAVAMEDISDSVYSYHVVRLRLKTDWDLYFRAYVFDTNEFLNQASRQCDGSGTRYVISLPKFRAMTVRFPPDIEEQHAIASVLSDMDAEITALEQRRDKTRAIKQGMMQQLLTGRVRLVKSK